MITIRCPCCEELRTEDELTYGGEADNSRPVDPDQVSDAEWTSYLYMRSNPKGLNQEQWCCSSGCGQWFKILRHTVTHQIAEIRRP